jgi:hypothetical protein
VLKDSDKVVIENFIQQPKQSRWLELMQSDQGRKKLRSTLAHLADFDPAAIVPISPDQQHPPLIHRLLTESGAPGMCSLISENADWDGLEMDLNIALKKIVGYGFGTIVNCVPGELAYFEGEGPKHRFILKKRR